MNPLLENVAPVMVSLFEPSVVMTPPKPFAVPVMVFAAEVPNFCCGIVRNITAQEFLSVSICYNFCSPNQSIHKGGIYLSLVYFALWVIFNGRVTTEIIIAGIFLSLLLDQFVKHVMHIHFTGVSFWKCLKLFPDAVFYVIVLLIEIIKANAAITKLVLAPEIDVEPCLVKFTTPLKSHTARTALANSITLIPGTITVSLEGNEFLVHALTRKMASGLEGSIFEKLLARMERIANA